MPEGLTDLLGWAKRFIRTPSVSRDGNRAVAEAAGELLERAGLSVRLQAAPGSEPEQINVVADAGPRTGRDLLLVTHLDTVPPGDPARWTATGGDPFCPTLEGDRLYGLGSADAKVDLVCKAFGSARVDLSALRRRLRVVGTFGEEIGLRGARTLVESGGTEGFGFALIGEPSELVCIRAHKGYAVYEARIPLPRIDPPPLGRAVRRESVGVSAHSSTPHLGENAVDAALDHLEGEGVVGLIDVRGGQAPNLVPDRCRVELVTRDAAEEGSVSGRVLDPQPLLAFRRVWRELLAELEEPRDPDFDPDHTVGGFGLIRVEGEEAVVTFDLRPVPEVDPEKVIRPLAELATLERLRLNPSLATSDRSPLVQAVLGAQERAGVPRSLGTKATCTEAGVLAQAGIEAVIFGPGLSVGNVHRPNEHTRISELEKAVEIYREVIQSLCIGEAPSCSS